MKGQARQIFVYILSIIILAVVFFYGFNAIRLVIDRGEDVVLAELESQVKAEVSKISKEFGRIQTSSFKVPSKYETICFVNSSLTSLPPDSVDAFIISAVEEQTGDDMFLLSRNITERSYDIGNITLSKNANDVDYLCVRTIDGHLSLLLEGIDDATKIYEKS